MARKPNIREDIAPWIDMLVEAYEHSDPENGDESEFEKLEVARHAINVWWKLYDRLVAWAQAHVTGYAMASNMPELVGFINERRGEELTEDSHFLEQMGYQYVYNVPDESDPEYLAAQKLFEEFEEAADQNNFKEFGSPPDYLHAVAFRFLVNELLMSTGANSSYWRFPLQRSLRALNDGEADDIATPLPGRHRGQPHFLKQWKLEALRQVFFRVGKGMKKYRALEYVADAIGQSAETLRDWEKALKSNADYAVDLECSEIAGMYERELTEGRIEDIPDWELFPSHRGGGYLGRANYLLKIIKKREFSEIRDHILRYRLPQQ